MIAKQKSIQINAKENKMLNIGCHISIAKGFEHAAKQAVSIGANTFQFFTRNPRGGKAKELDYEDLRKLESIMSEYKFVPLFAHASYTMNLCSNNEETREFAKHVLKDDIERIKRIGNAHYIFHPGSHVKQGAQKGIEYIVEALNEAIGPGCDVNILLEGMSGKGTEVGGNLEELKSIIEGVNHNGNMGICLDTCHLYSAGFDIAGDLDGVISNIDSQIGLERVKAIHLNDSKTPFGSKKDRHEIIGEGSIGRDAIIRLINHKSLKRKTFNLETPNEMDGYKREIEMLRKHFIEL